MKSKYSYTFHNIIAHPLMEILHLLGLTKLGDKIHDSTLPKEESLTKPPETDME